MNDRNALLRQLPQVETLLEHPALQKTAAVAPREHVVDVARAAIDEARQGVLAGTSTEVDVDAIAAAAQLKVMALSQRSLRRVINATGVVVHTNLGRSPLTPAAIGAVNNCIAGYSTLEYDTSALARGSRHDHCEQLICTLTGAEAAIAVNNNAAAALMILSEFAAGHEAIVSRGEEVEIGGSFRVPDIMAQSGAKMVEVGSTNKTHPRDYERALNAETSMLLKVHRSNFRIVGFTEEVSISELRTIADAVNAARSEGEPRAIVYEDQGSGSFIRLDCFGHYAEPTVAESIRAGADLVSFSGDKLLGGPQAGIIAGRKELIDRLKANPLARALRLDKMTIAALEATLRLYLDPERALAEIPTLRMLNTKASELRPVAGRLAKKLQAVLPPEVAVAEAEPCISRAGGGALPMCDIDSWAVVVTFAKGTALDCQRHMVSERALPVVGRVSKEKLLLDVRTLLSEEEQRECVAAVAEYCTQI